MTAAALAFPTSQTLAGWWRQIEVRQPLFLSTGSFLLHRVDAPVLVARIQPLDSLTGRILAALHQENESIL